MSIVPGSRFGPYEILASVGAGGMGEVYKAKDTRLDRTVAIKVLPVHIASDPEARQRFEREARTIASLNHPHICTLHDIGREQGVDFLVMEYLEGETLAARLAQKAGSKDAGLRIDEALRYAVEIADALDRAHRHGIVHRDLKPSNVMVTKDGAKLLDFGLAKLRPVLASPQAGLQPRPTDEILSALPTERASLTAQGTILGTLQYMAPEQLEGKEADARVDIFAFGAVVYEMVAGRKAFEGTSPASVIGAILKDEPPPVSTFQPLAPAALDRVIRICLAKDPDDRWQSARDLRRELDWIAQAGPSAGVEAPRPDRASRWARRKALAWVVAASALLVALVLGVPSFRSRPAPPRTIQSFILAPPGSQSAFASGFALSPDGRRLVFVSVSPDGKRALQVRALDVLSAQLLADVSGPALPFWSPDSRSIGFFVYGKLKKVAASGGPVQALCDVARGRGGTWNRDGVILFAGLGTPIYRIPSDGGSPTAVTRFDPSRKDVAHGWPSFLPDGRRFLYHATSEDPQRTGIYVGSIDGTGEDRFVLKTQWGALYADPGYVLFKRDTVLLAQRFDTARLAVMGDASPIADGVRQPVGWAPFVVSDAGQLAYWAGSELSRLTWVDRGGRILGTVGPAANYWTQRLSRDAQRVAANPDDDIWIYEVGQADARFTPDPVNTDCCAAWSPDDRRIVFRSFRDGMSKIYQKPATGGGDEELLFESRRYAAPSDSSLDGRFIALRVMPEDSSAAIDLWVYSLADKKTFPFVASRFAEDEGQFSPDGRWMAYRSDESGEPNIYIRPFPGPGGAVRISPAGGSHPRWRRDGREVFYLAPGGTMMAVAVTAGTTFQAGRPTPLFQMSIKDAAQGLQMPYDVAPDGQRFLVNVPVDEAQPLGLVQNWTGLLRR